MCIYAAQNESREGSNSIERPCQQHVNGGRCHICSDSSFGGQGNDGRPQAECMQRIQVGILKIHPGVQVHAKTLYFPSAFRPYPMQVTWQPQAPITCNSSIPYLQTDCSSKPSLPTGNFQASCLGKASWSPSPILWGHHQRSTKHERRSTRSQHVLMLLTCKLLLPAESRCSGESIWATVVCPTSRVAALGRPHGLERIHTRRALDR